MTVRKAAIVFSATIAMTVGLSQPAETDWVWWEAEDPIDTGFNRHPWPSQIDDPGVPSAGAVLGNSIEKAAGDPESAVHATYTVTVPVVGDYTLWVRKWGSGGASRWRFDDSEWRGTERGKPRGVEPGEKTRGVITLMWHNYGVTSLMQGQHTFRFEEPVNPDGSHLAVYDCFLLTRNTAYVPRGRFTPGDMEQMARLEVPMELALGPFTPSGMLPPDVRLDWGKEPVEALGFTRGRRVLNGVWRFMPAVGDAADGPRGSWGYIRVPGAWRADGWAAPSIPGIVAEGTGAPWGDVPVAELARAWYEREMTVPADWAGREIVLNLGRVCTDAVVYVDGRKCARIDWPGGEVVLTPFVEAGEKVLLQILVVATRNPKDVKRYLVGAAVRERSAGSMFCRGLIDDVVLGSRPRGTRIDGLFVKTSVRRQELAVDVDLTGVRSPGRATLAAVVSDDNGVVVRRFERTVTISGEDHQTVSVTGKWENPKLWDFRTPNLYTLALKAEGVGFSDEYRQRFGFREFRMAGKQFLLNETPFRLRPTLDCAVCLGSSVGMPEAVANQIDGFISAGFNFMEIWPKQELSRGLAIYWHLAARVADEKGFPLMYPALNLSNFGGRNTKDAQWPVWEKAMVAEWKRIRNHPSIVVLVCTANVYQHLDDQNPRRIGDMAALAVDTSNYRLARLYASGLKAVDIIRRYETTRPVTTHHGGSVGDFHTCDMYLNMIPLQEREDWLSAWAQSDESGPYMAIEFGTPWMATMHRARTNGGRARASEPFATEYCSIYLGADAFRNETAAYRNLIEAKYTGPETYSMWAQTCRPDYVLFPNHVSLQALFIRNTWRAWRTWGVTGGMIPWANGYGWRPNSTDREFAMPPYEPGRLGLYVSPDDVASGMLFADVPAYYYGLAGRVATDAGKALVETNSATLAWIAGSEAAFTAKDHGFHGGTMVRKQAVLINDERSAQDYEISWRAEMGGETTRPGG